MRKSNQSTGFGPLFSAVTAMVSPAHHAITRKPLYEHVEPLDFHPGFKALALRVFARISHWNQRSHERQALSSLDDHLLQDLGIERTKTLREAAKPFWRD